MNRVCDFLTRFHTSENIDVVFTEGCCYWFAKILYDRFADTPDIMLMYDEVQNHFGTRINGAVYDITGDVSNKYDWKPWNVVSDTLLRERIIRDCIMF